MSIKYSFQVLGEDPVRVVVPEDMIGLGNPKRLKVLNFTKE